jgi:galactokinase
MRQETKDDIKQLIEMSNARFESLRQEMNARFEAMEKANTARFEAQQKETNALRQEMNARFEALQKQIDGVQRQIAFMQWWFSIGGGLTLLLIVLKLFLPHIFPH